MNNKHQILNWIAQPTLSNSSQTQIFNMIVESTNVLDTMSISYDFAKLLPWVKRIQIRNYDLKSIRIIGKLCIIWTILS